MAYYSVTEVRNYQYMQKKKKNEFQKYCVEQKKATKDKTMIPFIKTPGKRNLCRIKSRKRRIKIKQFL